MAGRRSARISAVGMAGWTVPKLRAELARRGMSPPSWVRKAGLLRMLRQPNEGESLPVLIHNPDAATQGQSGPVSRAAPSGDDMGARAAEDIDAKINRLDNTITSLAATVGELAEIIPEITIPSDERNAGARDEYRARSHSKGAVPAARDPPGPQLHVTRRRRDGEPADWWRHGLVCAGCP